MLTIQAPAKINLTLEVLGRRADGYHEIRSVLQAVTLCDILHFEEAQDISFKCDDPLWDADKSLMVRAAGAVKMRLAGPKGASIKLEKRIPLSSGLGGDSSDAAAIIKGLNGLWDLRLTSSEMTDIAASLGSDVPFFLDGATALARGRGEILSSLPSIPLSWIVLMFPGVRVEQPKTARLYSLLEPEHYTSGSATSALAEHLIRGESGDSQSFYNVFEKVAFDAFIGLAKYFSEFQHASQSIVHLAGAGPTLFALYQYHGEATQVQRLLKHRGFAATLVQTLESQAVC